jgi:hypothetical protein
MNFGFIMVFIGFVLVYICMQIVPLYNLLSTFDNEECKKMNGNCTIQTNINH